jgi:hypothetical protein
VVLTVSPTEIRSGLRKLEFEALPVAAGNADPERVLVEFVRDQPLGADEIVRIALGLRDGLLRELVGQPQLVETKRPAKGKAEYYYRLSGTVDTGTART